MKTITGRDILTANNDKTRIKMLVQIIVGEAKYRSGDEEMSKFKIIDTRVQEILEQFPETRENDHKLYSKYLETYYYLEFNKKIFENYTEYNIPPFSSIERSARDIKNKYTNLKGNADTQVKRAEAEKEYKNHYGKK